MSKKFSIFLSALFCAFIGGMLLVSCILPDVDFSQLENRKLQELPKLTLRSVREGEFMEDAEAYAADHIAGRDLWVALQAWCERLTGKQENNGVYFGAQETLLNRLEEPDRDKLSKNMEYLDRLCSDVDADVYFGLIPSSAAIWSDRLPAGAPTANEKAVIDQLYRSTRAETVDLYGALDAHKGEDIYYRTDHHWTSLGAYYGYTALMDAMGLEAVPLDSLTPVTVTEDFNGTSFSTSGVRWLPPDSIQTYIPGDGLKVTRYPDGSPVDSPLYVDSYLKVKDKYSYFLGGVQPLCTIETGLEDAPKILLVRDSYSDSLAPFLTKNFSEIHLWDLRWNNTSLQTYIAEHDINDVVVLYSISNYVGDTKQVLLTR